MEASSQDPQQETNESIDCGGISFIVLSICFNISFIFLRMSS